MSDTLDRYTAVIKKMAGDEDLWLAGNCSVCERAPIEGEPFEDACPLAVMFYRASSIDEGWWEAIGFGAALNIGETITEGDDSRLDTHRCWCRKVSAGQEAADACRVATAEVLQFPRSKEADHA